jgi:hypothetical protein
MTVKITQVNATSGEILLTLTYDNPKGSGNFATFSLKKSDLCDRLIEVRLLLDRSITLTDAKEAILAIINEVRKGKTGIPEDFNFAPFINVELEVV